MRTLFPDLLGLTLAVCEGIDARDGVRQTIDLFRLAGGRFIYRGGLEPHPTPEQHVWKCGTLSLDVRHPALGSDEFSQYDAERFGPLAWELPRAGFACFPKNGTGFVPVAEWAPVRAITMSQPTGFWQNEERLEPVAQGLVRMVEILYPFFRPRFCYVDECARGAPPLETYLGADLPRLFWATVFGPDHVARLGRDFLHGAPAWRFAELPDGGALLVATESYLEWWHSDNTELRDYFRTRLPGIDIYRGEPSEGG